LVFINLVQPFFERFIDNESSGIYLLVQLSTFCTVRTGKFRVVQIAIPIYVSESSNTRRMCYALARTFCTCIVVYKLATEGLYYNLRSRSC
jgi:hypothetical protein